MERQKSSNPVLVRAFKRVEARVSSEPMTLGGTMRKTALMLALVVLGAYYTWDLYKGGSNVIPYAVGGAIGALVLGFVIPFNVSAAKYLAPIYAVLEGLFLGGISAIFELKYPGLPMRAVGLSFAVAFVMLALYYFRVIRVTQRLRSLVIAATLAILTYYLFSWLATAFFNFQPFDMSSSLPSIGFSLLVVGLAAFNLLLDFDLIEGGIERGAPKEFEWYGAFGLTVTLVWLYFELLRLLAKLGSRS